MVERLMEGGERLRLWSGGGGGGGGLCSVRCETFLSFLSVSILLGVYLCIFLSHFNAILSLRQSLCLSMCVCACPSHRTSLYRYVCRFEGCIYEMKGETKIKMMVTANIRTATTEAAKIRLGKLN